LRPIRSGGDDGQTKQRGRGEQLFLVDSLFSFFGAAA
jgi:hypothetical protein